MQVDISKVDVKAREEAARLYEAMAAAEKAHDDASETRVDLGEEHMAALEKAADDARAAYASQPLQVMVDCDDTGFSYQVARCAISGIPLLIYDVVRFVFVSEAEMAEDVEEEAA